MCMVIQIAGQEDAGSGKRRNHAGAVQSDLLASDQHASGRKQNCAGAVQYGIQSGKNAVVGHTSYAAGTVLWRLATRIQPGTPRPQILPTPQSKAISLRL